MTHPLAFSSRHWPPSWREELEERSAIIQADEGCTRAEADARAEAMVRARHAARQGADGVR